MPGEPNPSRSGSGVLERGKNPLPPRPKRLKKPDADLVEPVILPDEGEVPVPPVQVPRPKPKPPVRKPASPTAARPLPGPSPDEEADRRATEATWQQMVMVYGLSLVLHAAVLVVLGLMVLPQEVREEILSVLAEQEVAESEQPPLEHIIPEPEIIEERALEEAAQDVNALVESDAEAESNFKLNLSDDAFSLKPDTAEGPAVPVKIGSISAGRSEAARAQMLAERGGNAASDAAVESALEWLASVQKRDGSWDFNDVGKSSGAGSLSSPTGATGLTLLAFLGAGHTHMKECKYQETVKRGVNYLLKAGIPRPAGLDFRGRSPGNEGMYVQAIVATALAEAHGMTNDRRIRPIAQGAVEFIVRAQHSGGGWRYKPDTPGDTSVVGWQVMALKSAYAAKIPIPRTVSQGINRFLADVSHEEGAKYSYMPGQPPRASTTSIGLLCRMYMGWKADNPALVNGVKYLAQTGPSKSDIYYDYYASQVMIQFTGAKGELWDKWNTTMRDWLVETQKKSGPEVGSWDIIENGHKGDRGGRLYTTCLAVMTLEIYYRVLPLYQRAAVEGEF